jgi:DNA-binding response OmpR family regulator
LIKLSQIIKYYIIVSNTIVLESFNNNDNYILLVEDEKDILDLFTEYLSSNGFNTISFQNPKAALNYFYQNQSNCSIVITDYKMPQMSGIDLIKKIREKDTNCKIKTIIISAFIKDNIPYDKSYSMTIDRILEKPVYLDRLKKVIQELIQQSIFSKTLVVIK